MCVLRASGASFEPESFLQHSTLHPCLVFHAGQPRHGSHDSVWTSSGFNVVVSEASRQDFGAQVSDASAFLDDHREELLALRSARGLQDVRLDFPIDLRIDGRRVLAQWDYFPAEFVRKAGALGLALEISIYGPQDDRETSRVEEAG